MSVQLQLRRGTTAAIGGGTPAAGEVIVDTTKKTLAVGDGSTAGGTPLAKEVHTHVAADISDSTSVGRSVLTAADAAAARTALDAAATSHNQTASTITDLQEAVEDIVGAALEAGTNITITYTDGTGRIKIDAAGGSGGTTDIGALVNVGLSASVAAGALTISLTTAAGSTPSGSSKCIIPFRSATAATGTITPREVTASNTLVISSGSTMGFANATAGRLWIVAFDDGGTIRLGAINCLSGTNIFPLGGFAIASSTAEGGAGAADSAHVFYSGTAVTSKAFTILGYLEWASGLTTAGTWDAAPTRIIAYRPGLKLPGDTVQIVPARYTTNAVLSTTVPVDDTIPQVTEGTQIISAAITPSSATNIIRTRFSGSAASTGGFIMTALFLNGASNAVLASAIFPVGAGAPMPVVLDEMFLAGSTTAQTFTVRTGSNTGSVAFNGTAGPARYMGGTQVALFVAEEVMT